MRILLYIVSMIGFAILGYQLLMLAASIAAYIVIMVIGILLLIAGFILKTSFFAALFTAGTICDIADATNYFEIQKERARLKEIEDKPTGNIWQYEMKTKYQKYHRLKYIYQFADEQLFQQYSNAIINKQYNTLNDIAIKIKQSHQINMNNYARSKGMI